MLTILLALLLPVVAHSSANVLVGADPSCTKNNCLAVVATNSRREGLTQCTNFLRKTVIPSTRTTTLTTTIRRTSTATGTSTNTVTDTVFSPVATQTAIVTTTVDPTSTVTITSIVTTTITQGGATIQTTTLNAPTTVTTVTSFSTVRTKTTLVQTVTSKSTIATTLTSSETTTVSGTNTATVTATLYSVVTAISPSPTSCDNEADAPSGIQWAYYDYSGDILPPYANYDPTSYKTMTPLYNSTWSGFGGFDDLQKPTDTIYGSSQQLNTSTFVINHRGYFYAAESGYYGFAFVEVDDLVDFWIGDHAFVGWDRSNARIEVQYGTPNPNMRGGGTAFVPLEPGYHPYRLLYMQATGGLGFESYVYDPNGDIVLDWSSTPSPRQIIQYSCDPDDGAPPFPQFGSEI